MSTRYVCDWCNDQFDDHDQVASVDLTVGTHAEKLHICAKCVPEWLRDHFPEERKIVTDGGEDVASEWDLECQDCDWSDEITAECHPAEGPPKAVEKQVRIHKNTTDESHIVRVKGTHVVDDQDIDPSLLTDGGIDHADAASDSGVDPRNDGDDATSIDAPEDFEPVDLDIDAPHVAFEHADTGLLALARNPVNVWYIEIWTPADDDPDFRTGSRLRKTSAISLLETKLETSADGTFMGYPETAGSDGGDA